MGTLPLPEVEAWHALAREEVIAKLGSSPTVGLTTSEVERRRREFGPNELPAGRRRALVAVFLHQFASPLIYLLLAAALLAFVLGELSDGIVILVVVALNAVIGAVQEQRAENALAALHRMVVQEVQVLRDGHETVVDARELVPGDLLLLNAGDAVAADARLIDGAALQLAEAALTGESVPVPKDTAPVVPGATLADRHDMVYAGTHVTAGRARAIVVATALATEIGHIATLAEGGASQATPLEKRVARFGRAVMFAAIGVLAVFVVVGFARGLPAGEIAMLGISQVVGLIPEGLPVAMTIALAVGVQRMARRRAIVRRLSAVETLGSTSVICTDKTGTLTRNEMTATEIVLAAGRHLTVSGSGYAPEGELHEGEVALSIHEADPDLHTLLQAGALCNDAHLLAPDGRDPRWRPVGDPTEAALLTLALKGGLAPDALRKEAPRRAELPFDSTIKLMATEHDVAGRRRIYIKGAPEAVLSRCETMLVRGDRLELDEPTRDQLRTATEEMAGRALRVLAVAMIDEGELPPDGSVPTHATLIGLVGQIDPPRREAAAAVASCRSAGIRPVMVTGDHRTTGLAIARTLGIAGPEDLAIESGELAGMTTEALAAKLDHVAVFARVQPAQKVRIVEAYQRRGDVVAMTGDGVNDAPALVRADVGVAMGITGTDVAKAAAKIIVTDDNFGSIVDAVEDGRVVYRNIKKAVLFLLATSFAEVVVLVLAVAIGYPAPFAAVQILWNNLVTEGVITINLVMNPAEGDEMRQPPIHPGERLVSRRMRGRLLVMTPTIAAVTLGWFIYRIESGVPYAIANTETFTLLAVCEWFNVLNCLSARRSALSLQVFQNRWLVGGLIAGNLLQAAVVFLPPLNRVFYTTPIGIGQVLAIGAAGSLVLWVEEIRKLVVRRRTSLTAAQS